MATYKTLQKISTKLILLLCLMCSSLIAQPTWKVDLDGGVKDEDTKLPLEGAKVELYKDGSIVKTLYASEKGKYSFLLEPNNSYLIKVSFAGFISKLITITTENVPERLNKADNFYVKMQVSLFKEVPDIDFSVLEKPIGSIFYDNKEEKYGYDVDYELSKRLEQLQKDYDKKLKERVLAEKKAKDEATKKELAEKNAAERAKIEAEKSASKNAAEQERATKKKLEEEEAEKEAKKKVEANLSEVEKEAQRKAAKKEAEAEEKRKKEAKEEAEQAELKKKNESAKEREERKKAEKESFEKAVESKKKEIEEKKELAKKAKEEAALKRKEQGTKTQDLVAKVIARKEVEVVPVENIRTSQSEGVNYHIDHTFITILGEEVEYKKIVYTWGGIYHKRGGLDITDGTYRQEMVMYGVETPK